MAANEDWRTRPIAGMVTRVVLDCGSGYVVVVCPFDDGTADHALHVCNPTGDQPAHLYCLSDACAGVSADKFAAMLDLARLDS